MIHAKGAPSAIDSEIERLWTLERMNLGPVKYYSSLAESDKDILAVGGANVLLDQRTVPDELKARIVQLSRFQSVQLRAFAFFTEEFDYEHAEAVLSTPLRPTDDLIKRQLKANLEDDASELASIEVERFFRTGEVEPLNSATASAETAGGWRRALPLLVDLILINPQNSQWPMQLGRALRSANEFTVLKRFCEIVDKIEIFPNISMFYKAVLCLKSGSAEEGIRYLDRVSPKSMPAHSLSTIMNLRAELLEKLGRFEDAYRAYVKQNMHLRSPDFNPSQFFEKVLAKNTFAYLDPGEDGRDDHYLMLGFPRSGTTLLENVLATHPKIETFEEIPSFGAINHLFRNPGRKGTDWSLRFPLEARERYYREIDRRKKKVGAEVFIDKLPINSAEAVTLKRLFPNKKYIFSIRHPYDVVLSCFKQTFNPNAAMDNFTTFEDSCRMYDFTMTQWFSQFKLESESVCYVRYDRLVENLKEEASRVLAFLGMEWHEDLLKFAERASDRRVRTPSYANVRQGLSIGVQSSWKNYTFLFKEKHARQLDRWVNHFGYTGV